MSATKHKSTGNPLDRLTSEERQLAFQAGLAREVGNACDLWLRGRGIGPGKLFTHDGPLQRAGDDTAGQDGTNLTTNNNTK